MQQMAGEIIPANFKTEARLKYDEKGGAELQTKEDIFKLCTEITNEIEQEKQDEKSSQGQEEDEETGNSNQEINHRRANDPRMDDLTWRQYNAAQNGASSREDAVADTTHDTN